MDESEARSPQDDGVFITIKFPQDMRGVFLTLNLGHRRAVATLGRPAARKKWARRCSTVTG